MNKEKFDWFASHEDELNTIPNEEEIMGILHFSELSEEYWDKFQESLLSGWSEYLGVENG